MERTSRLASVQPDEAPGRTHVLILDGQGQAENNNGGKEVIVIESHSARSIDLILEFIYGNYKIEEIEYAKLDHPVIQSCVLLYGLGHDFEIAGLCKYATHTLGTHLNRKLKEICVQPLSQALEAARRNGFIEDLEAGIVKADEARRAGEERKLPLLMLTDLVVVARDVLLREARFRLTIDQDLLPGAFIREVLLAQFGKGYQTTWMRNLMVRPQKAAVKRVKCAGCGEGIAKDEEVVFNPWSGVKVSQRYTQVCCEECAQGMDKGKGKGVSWQVFDDSQN